VAQVGQAGRVGGGADGRGGDAPQVVFVLNEKGEPQPARVRLGISDGQFVEVREGLEQGARVVTAPDAAPPAPRGARPAASPGASNPFNLRKGRSAGSADDGGHPVIEVEDLRKSYVVGDVTIHACGG
jgi:hypothetical protein